MMLIYLLNNLTDSYDVKLNPNTEIKYISFTKILKYDSKKQIELRFIDSFKFLSSSLDKLSKNLENISSKHYQITFQKST